MSDQLPKPLQPPPPPPPPPPATSTTASAEQPAVKVYVRPLEVTVPAEDLNYEAPPPLPSEQPPKTVWSTMTSRIETETSVKRWSIPPVKTEEGNPPGPGDNPTTKQGKEQEGRMQAITPNYKLGHEQPRRELNLGRSGYLPNESGDYKMSMRQEDYKLTVIDPKVRSNANMPHLSSKLPDARRQIAGDFPSEHSKRSQIKLEPLEQRRFRSVESRPVTTSNYLTQSVERHRDMEASRLREYLKAKEGDANQPWDKPGWPGPKRNNDDESLRELETIKQKVETLKRRTSMSMHDLRVLTPVEFERRNFTPQPPTSPQPSDGGWLIRMRTNRYLNEASRANDLRKYKSADELAKMDSGRPVDPLHWQLRKEFHLTSYSERRSSWSQLDPTTRPATAQSQTPSTHGGAQPPPPPSPPPLPPSLPATSSASRPPSSNLNRGTSRSQLLYPPGSTENIASEKKPAERPPEKVVYENKPVPASVVGVAPEQQHHQQPSRGRPKTRDPEEDYPERLMSPPPTHQPRSILKGYSSQQYYTESHEMRPPSATTTHFEDLSEEEKTRIMRENLQRHRQSRSTPSGPKPATASFNGPFFKLEEVSPKSRSQSVPTTNGVNERHERSLTQVHEYGYSLSQMNAMSASEIELDKHNFGSDDPSVVVWPPMSDRERPRSHSVMARNFADPERIDEYKRQKRLEEEAIRRADEKKMMSYQKQVRAIEIQQQRLYEQQHGVTSPVPIMDAYSPAPQIAQYPPHYSQPQLTPQQHFATSHMPPTTEEPHSHVRVFETRPISSLSEAGDPADVGIPSGTTWKRTYIVEKPKNVAKNEILTSEELLEKDQYEVDLLRRREAFVEKPEDMPAIQRTGRRWQPPPEKPYVWPTLRRPISVEPTMGPPDYDGGRSGDDDEYKWTPVVNDPAYKREHKNFTPQNSPPASPRRGHGAGPLEEPAKRQTKYVIQPSPDGSHRPKPAFRKERHAPSGGFFPHAPNAIKIVKRRAASAMGLLAPTGGHHPEDSVEVIHQRNYHRLESVDRRMGQSELDSVPDWEKIYELPPHSSQLVSKEMPRHVDVRRRLSQFEHNAQGRTRTSSVESQPHYPMPDYDAHPTPHPPHRSHSRQENVHYRSAGGQPQQISRRNSVASTRIDTPPMVSTQSRRTHHRGGDSRIDSRMTSRPASSIPMSSPQPRPTTPGASRARNFIARATAPSPTPFSYDRARPYLPPALPPGYRLADPQPDLRATSPQPGHTKKMIRNEANKPPANAELDELARRNEELERRSRDRRSQYKLIDSEIIKQNPEPVPAQFKLQEQVRELLESRNSVDTTASAARDNDRSGYVTDVSTATWQFSTHSFSPRSIVSVNGARDDILKKVPPLREPTPQPPAYRYQSLPALQPAIIHIQDEKPRSIMKRRELESREQLLYPQDSQVVKSYSRSTSNVARPTVTETVQRFEETRRTEEVERRVQRREKKERRSRHHSSSRHQSGWDSGYHAEYRYASLPRNTIVRSADRSMTNDEIDKVVREAYQAADEARREHRSGHRSSSLSRGGGGGGGGGFTPGGQESYYKHETTRRTQNSAHDDHFNRGLAHARYGSLSDSLRRGELKYVPNGDVRESYYRSGGEFGGASSHQHQQQQQHQQRNMHKSHSTRDVFMGGDDRRSVSSYRRGSQQVSPFIEFPPTLPRRHEREENYFRPVSKSRSYADWDDAGRAGAGREVRRYDDDMGRLEAEFRDSLLMPMPNGNVNEKDYRTEQLPGGYETFNKERHANSGRRSGRDGKPVDFNEASQEYSYKREQQFDDRRRR